MLIDQASVLQAAMIKDTKDNKYHERKSIDVLI